MVKSGNSKLSLFLMELIIAILFFSLSAAVCLRLFVSAHSLAENAQNTSNAIKWSQSLAEVFYNQKGNPSEIASLFPDAFLTLSDDDADYLTGTVILVFDNEWNVTDEDLSSASYEAILETYPDKAKNVYADITDYPVDIKGDAIVGHLAVLDIRNEESIISEIPSDPANIIYENSIDVYLGEVEKNE